jgi:hypothetical protein
MEFDMSKVNPGIVSLNLPGPDAASRACRKLLSMPGSPERVADMIDKLSSIIFRGEEQKFIRYEWILLILQRVFENEPFSEDLNDLLSIPSDGGKMKSNVSSNSTLKDGDFSDFNIPCFNDLLDKAEGQFETDEEYLSTLQEVSAEFLVSVQLLLDINSSKKEGDNIIINLGGKDIFFTNLMDDLLNGDLLERFPVNDIASAFLSLPPGALEKVRKRLDGVFNQSIIKRKFYSLSLKRFMGRISYYKSNEQDNLYYKEKLSEYQLMADTANKKISNNENKTQILLDFKESLTKYVISLESGKSVSESKKYALDTSFGEEFMAKVEKQSAVVKEQKAESERLESAYLSKLEDMHDKVKEDSPNVN